MNTSWLNTPLSTLLSPRQEFAPASVSQGSIEVGSLSSVKQSVGPRVDATSPLGRDDRTLYKTNVTDYRYARTADELLMLLAKNDPDVSAGVWNFMRLADSGLKFVALNAKLIPDAALQQALEAMLFRMSGMQDYKNWDIHKPIEQVANTIMKYILIRGGSGLELVLNKNKTAQKLVIVDPITVRFKHTAPGVFVPYQQNEQGKEVKLDIPTFFWGLLDPDTESPYENPPFLPVIQAVLFNISVMQDLERIVKRVAFPRVSVKIIEETLRKFAPMDAQTDESKMSLWLRSQKSSIGEALKDLAPEDAAVFFDSLEVSMLETKHNVTVDFRPLKEVIDQRIIAGLKSLPTILGRQFGSSQTIGGVEALLYAKSIGSIQSVAAFLLSRALTLALQLEGKKGFVKVTYRPVNMRPDNELEAFEGLKQARILEQLSLGMITDEEAVTVLTGNPILPPGYTKLAGTGFYNGKSGNQQAIADVNATRDPTAREAAGGGRGR